MVANRSETPLTSSRPPLILVPGSLHSRLLLASAPTSRCAANPPGTVAYVNWSAWRSAPAQECWIAQLALVIDEHDRFVSPAGVNVSVACGADSDCFGATAALPACDPWTCPQPSAYGTFVSALLDAGYRAGSDLFVAAYDWRHAPGRELDPFCRALARLVERAAAHAPAVIAGHSAGPALIGHCLRAQSAPWRRRFVRGMLSLNGLVGGEIDCLETLWRGGDFRNAAERVTSWDAHAYRATQWSWGVTAWCLPQPGLYGRRPLVSVGSRDYSAEALPALFDLVGATPLGRTWPLVVNATPPEAAPGVRTVWCVYGVGVPTPVHYRFADGNLSTPPEVTMGDGDGQQPTESNAACARWRAPGAEVLLQAFPRADHDSILSDERVLRYVLDTVLAP